MFEISIYKLGNEPDYCLFPTTLETLADAELVAQARAEQVFGVKPVELVYIEDLSYYAYVGQLRIGRITIMSLCCEQETRV